MYGRRASIAGVMKVTAIVALSLALLRFVPNLLLQIPVFVFLIVALELAIVHASFGRPLRTFYFTFLIVGALLTGVITALFFSEFNPVPGSLQNLEAALQSRRGTPARSRIIALYVEFPMLATADGFVTCLLGLLPAWGAAVLASRWMRRRSGCESKWGQCIHAFLRGALIGLGLFFCSRLLLAFFLGQRIFGLGHSVGLVGSPLLGGLALATWTELRLRIHQGRSPKTEMVQFPPGCRDDLRQRPSGKAREHGATTLHRRVRCDEPKRSEVK